MASEAGVTCDAAGCLVLDIGNGVVQGVGGCKYCDIGGSYACNCWPRLPQPTNEGAIAPIPMLLWCPECGTRHIDEGEFATKPHHTHACQGCGMVWRPAIVPTVGAQFLPGFKNAPKETE